MACGDDMMTVCACVCACVHGGGPCSEPARAMADDLFEQAGSTGIGHRDQSVRESVVSTVLPV